MGMLKEFKDFAMKGNVMDLAIGVIIGGAFNGIVTALVDNVIMPVLGMLIGNTSKFKSLEVGGIQVGELIQAVLDFIIIAFVLFLLVKLINRVRASTVSEGAKPAGPSRSEVLLEEIRDALRK